MFGILCPGICQGARPKVRPPSDHARPSVLPRDKHLHLARMPNAGCEAVHRSTDVHPPFEMAGERRGNAQLLTRSMITGTGRHTVLQVGECCLA